MFLIARGAVENKLSPGKEEFSIGNRERGAEKRFPFFFPFFFFKSDVFARSIDNQRLSLKREFRNAAANVRDFGIPRSGGDIML